MSAWFNQTETQKSKTIQYLQSWRTERIDWFAKIASFCSDELFCLISVMPTLWGPIYSGSHRLIMLYASSIGLCFIVGNMVKNWFKKNRAPSHLVQKLAMIEFDDYEFSFPSTHATNSLSTVILFAYHFLTLSDTPVSMFSILMWSVGGIMWTVPISLSRVYLGAHYLQDTIGGWILGIICAITIALLGDTLAAYSITSYHYVPLLISLAMLFILLKLHPLDMKSSQHIFHKSEATYDSSAPALGCIAGCWLALYYFEGYKYVTSPPTYTSLILRYIVGVPMVIGIYFSLRYLLPEVITPLLKFFKVKANYVPYGQYKVYLMESLRKTREGKHEKKIVERLLPLSRVLSKFLQYVITCLVIGSGCPRTFMYLGI